MAHILLVEDDIGIVSNLTEFLQKEFHEDVLATGPAPLELVEKYMGKLAE